MSLPQTYNAFLESLKAEQPPALWPEALKAIWWDARGNWEASHEIAQDLPTPVGSWIHGYLHRKEGDEWNAGYWYRRAGRAFPQISLDEEAKELTLMLLSTNGQ